MSLENDFHKLIESQNKQGKEELWKKIECNLQEEEPVNVENEGEVLVLSKNHRFFNTRNIIIFFSVLLVFVVGLILIFNFCLVKKPDGEIEKPDDRRYCSINDYDSNEVNITVKQYATENNLQLLYFDYELMLFTSDLHYKLKDTGEIVCLQEDLIDSQGAYIVYYITDNKTDIDVVHSFAGLSDQETAIQSTKIKYGFMASESYANFEYQGYCYYLKITDAPSDGYILELVETLLT